MSEEKRRRIEESKKVDEHGLLGMLNPASLRSIKEIVRYVFDIPELGLNYLDRKQRKFLLLGGDRIIKTQNPALGKFVDELMKRTGVFPIELYSFAEEVQERIREKARKGLIDKKYEKVRVSASEVDNILRFKRDPIYSSGEKTRILAETIVELLEEKYKEEKEKMLEGEPDVKVALELAKRWLLLFKKANGLLTEEEVVKR